MRQTFEMCKKNEWNKEWVVEVGKILQDLLVAPETCLGIKLHITEVYMEELAKVSFHDTSYYKCFKQNKHKHKYHVLIINFV